MKRYLLDTSALLTPRDDEPGAARVSEVLQQAAKGKANPKRVNDLLRGALEDGGSA